MDFELADEYKFQAKKIDLSCLFFTPVFQLFNFKTTEMLVLNELENPDNFLSHILEKMTCLKYLEVINHINAPYLLPKNHVLELFHVDIPHGIKKQLSQILINWNPKHAEITRISLHKKYCEIDLRLSAFYDNEKTIHKLMSGSQQQDQMDIINSYKC